MLSALALSALVLAHPTGAPAPAVAAQDDPAIRIWLSDDGRYQRGDAAKVQVKSREDGFLLVLHVDPDGHLRVLFPLDPNDNAQVSGGKKYEIIGRGGREAFTVANRSGQGTVYAAVSRDPFRFEGYVAGDHWDYAALDNVRISDKPESDLNEFVQRLARSDFDYDVLNYSVYENVVYGQGTTTVYNYGPMGYSDYYGGYGCYGYWGCGGSSFFISFGFPYYYSPFYYPRHYYPAYYYPGYYHYPYYYYPGYYYPYYPRYNYPVHYPYFPWRQRGAVPYANPYSNPYSYPWRTRGANQVYTNTGFQWRAREVATRTPTNGALAAAYRGRFAESNSVVGPVGRSARGSTTVASTPVRTREPVATTPTPRRSLDMTPGRTEKARRAGTALSDEPQRPVGRRAVDRPGNSSAQPQRVNPGNRGAARVEVAARPSNSPERVPQARPAGPQPRDWGGNDGGTVIGGEDRSGYEGARVIPARAPEARRAEDDRPASRPNIERGQMQSPGVRMDQRDDPAPVRSQPRDNSPPPRAEPRQESRPAPSGRGGNDGWGGGGGRGGWGGGAPSARGDGGGGGGSRGGGGMSVPTRHR
jgi:hypothetical protein